jgi:hypothetical protein
MVFQKLMRHKSLEITMRYAHIHPSCYSSTVLACPHILRHPIHSTHAKGGTNRFGKEKHGPVFTGI